MNRKLLLLILLGAMCVTAKGQNVALKTNVLSDAFSNINLGLEIGLAPRWTLNIGGEFNDWTLSHGRRWKHWGVEPEFRWYFCDRFAGHFLGIDPFCGQYNVGGVGKDFKFLGTDFGATIHNRYQGWFYGLGVSYGYAFVLGKHWNLEPMVGIGYCRFDYDKYACTGCGEMLGSGHHNYWGITKAALNLVYVF